MWLFALYVITTFVTFVLGSIYGARAEKAATAGLNAGATFNFDVHRKQCPSCRPQDIESQVETAAKRV